MQFLFGLDFTGYAWDAVIDGFWAAQPAKAGVQEYANRLIRGVCERQTELDGDIGQALEYWTPDRVGHIERAILRIALYEMRYVDDVPPKVAINEALEIAKSYGFEEAPRFVNGVLDQLKPPGVDTEKDPEPCPPS
ncbi:MAG: transcription antitermination protein NusB [Candidatus Hydrogenedentes bacterium]|nr:transcription antitermination protein NusB [Candidatus Hydrogenedentota bacterium]